MTTDDLKKMPELEVIKIIKNPATSESTYNLACSFLMQKYEKMFHHNWHVLCRQMNNSELVMSLKDEYYSEAYEAFLVVLSKVDLRRVYDEKFKIMQLLSFYLRNVRAKMIKETLKKSKLKSITSMTDSSDSDVSASSGIDPDVDLSYWNAEGYVYSPEYICEKRDTEEYCDRAIARCEESWSNQQKAIFAGLRENKTRAEISRMLGIPMSKIYSEIKILRADVKAALGC